MSEEDTKPTPAPSICHTMTPELGRVLAARMVVAGWRQPVRVVDCKSGREAGLYQWPPPPPADRLLDDAALVAVLRAVDRPTRLRLLGLHPALDALLASEGSA